MLATTLTRRDFLKTIGLACGHFSLPALAACAGTAPVKNPEQLAGKTLATDQVDGFLAIDANGNVLAFSGKVDLGTGIKTAMTQIAAEELSVPFERVTVGAGRHAADARPGRDLRQSSHPERRHADPTGRGHCARGARRGRREKARRAARSRGRARRPYRSRARSVTYAEIIGERNSTLRSTQGHVERPGHLYDRRQVRRTARHSRQGHGPLHLHAGFQGPGYAACAWGAASSDEGRPEGGRRQRGEGGIRLCRDGP